MKTIASFEVDHTKLKEGIYLSRIDRDVVTYDLRFVIPNNPENIYMENAAMHTVEHLFAVHARNGKYGGNIIYFGPMGCRTGFYLLMRGCTDSEAYGYVKETLENIISHDGEMFGASPVECGNWLELDLGAAKREAKRYLDALKAREAEGKADLRYDTK